MAEITLKEVGPSFSGPAGEAIARGDLLYYSQTNSDWRKAEADGSAESQIFPFAEMVALSSASADGDAVLMSPNAVLSDIDDNSFSSTVADTLYLSGTAGATTSTRPTGANDIKQVVGQAYGETGTTGATIAVINLTRRHETINLQFPYTEHSAPQDADGDFHGVGLDDTSAAVAACFMVPENATGRIIIAYFWLSGTGTALDASDTYTFDASAGVDDETTSATTDGISAAALTVAASDLARKTVTTGLDASGIIEPGNVVGIDIKKAAEGAGGDDPICLCCSVVLEVAG